MVQTRSLGRGYLWRAKRTRGSASRATHAASKRKGATAAASPSSFARLSSPARGGRVPAVLRRVFVVVGAAAAALALRGGGAEALAARSRRVPSARPRTRVGSSRLSSLVAPPLLVVTLVPAAGLVVATLSAALLIGVAVRLAVFVARRVRHASSSRGAGGGHVASLSSRRRSSSSSRRLPRRRRRPVRRPAAALLWCVSTVRSLPLACVRRAACRRVCVVCACVRVEPSRSSSRGVWRRA
jgi:hypothetical protein